jgi:hypothetical protein
MDKLFTQGFLFEKPVYLLVEGLFAGAQSCKQGIEAAWVGFPPLPDQPEGLVENFFLMSTP